MGKCKKCCKNSYDIRVKCKPAHDDKESDAGPWNLAVIPDPAASSFRTSTSSDAQYTTTSYVVDNHANFSVSGMGAAVESDLFNTIKTLEKPAVANSVNGFSIYLSVNDDCIIFIQNDIAYESTRAARIFNTNKVKAGSGAPPATTEYECWSFITHELLE